MNNTGSRLIILLLGDPHLLEGCEGRKDGSTNPYGVLSFWWSNDFNFHGGRSQIGDLLLHSVGNSGVHGGSPGKDNIAVEVTSDVNIALHDGVAGGHVRGICGLIPTRDGLKRASWLEFVGTD